jgi:antitoxin (DNA-binding transcriptional repressor) of toxin-antitoxin stability system
MTTVTVEDIQRDLRSYLRQVRDGASLVIIEANHPVAEIKPFVEPAEREVSGQAGAEVAGHAAQAAEVGDLEARIDLLYGEIRDLLARSAGDPAVAAQAEQKRQQLRSLQERQAELLERRAATRLRFDRETGEQLLARAEKLLER